MAYVIRLSAGVLAVPLGEEFAMTQIPSGILADTVGPRLSTAWGMALAGAGAFLFAAAALLPPPLPKGTLMFLLFGLGFFAGALVVPWTTAKELNSPRHTGLAIAVMNTAAFLAVAVLTSSMGWALDGPASLHGAEGWGRALLLPLGMAAAGLIGALFTPETFGRQ